MVPRPGATVVLLLVSAAVAVWTVSASAQSGGTFRVTRVVAALGVERGQPVDPATQFPPDAGRIFVWFQATPAPRDITVRTEWYINDAHVDDASYDVTVTQGIEVGYFSLALPPGTPFPEGNYRVELTVGGLVLGTHRFTVRGGGATGSAASQPAARRSSTGTTPGPASGAMRAPGASTLERPALGFSLSIPAGWAERPNQDAAAAIGQEGQPDEIGAMVFVQKEAAASKVTDVLAKAAVKMKADTARTFISSTFDIVLDRPALIVVLEDETKRYKLTLLPRDEEDTSQVYYAVSTGAPKASWASVETTLDRIVAGFQVLPMAGDSARAPATPPAVKAPLASGMLSPGTSPAGFDRSKVIERMLAPRPARKPDGRH